MPDLQACSALFERNYAGLLQLFAGCSLTLKPGAGCQICVDSHCYRLRVTADARWTTEVELNSAQPHSWLATQMSIRLYHDARMAEVCASQQISHPRGRYHYPNDQMFQQDEKFQANRLLADWLRLCLAHGQPGTTVCSLPTPDD